GSRLAIALAPTPLVDDTYMKRKVHVVDADRGDVIARLDNPGKLGMVAWSPDGNYLAMVSAADLHDPAEGRLMVAPASGGPLRDLLPNYEGHIRAIAWQDADTLMYLGEERVWTTFGQISRSGANRKTLVPNGPPILTGFSLSKDGRRA